MVNTSVARNPDLIGVQCIRCSSRFPVSDYSAGCANCAGEGHAANVVLRYRNQQGEASAALNQVNLPYRRHITLGEGQTPLIEAPDLENLSRASVHIKLESCNPTGSHKDRFSAMAVSRGVEGGYSEVVAASSGNAGLSIAAYAARAGLGCKIAITDDVPAPIVQWLRDLGAELHVSSDLGRWQYVSSFAGSRSVLPLTNYHLPTVGSHAFGIEGFKPIAQEILAQLSGHVPEWVVVPSSRGDLGWGIHLGFREVLAPEQVPRIALVEPFPRLMKVLESGHDYRETFPGSTRTMPSIAGNTVTYQALAAIRESRGTAVVVSQEDARKASTGAWSAGLTLETSSSAALAATEQLLHRGVIREGSSVVAIGTSHGFKGF